MRVVRTGRLLGFVSPYVCGNTVSRVLVAAGIFLFGVTPPAATAALPPPAPESDSSPILNGGVDNGCQVARLIAPVPLPYDRFGWDVAISGDRAIATSPWVPDVEHCPATESCGYGAAFVFRREDLAWTLEAKLEPPGPKGYFEAGSVDLSGDLAALGSSSHGIGFVSVYRRGGDHWTLDGRLQAADGMPYDYFGRVAIRGNLCVVGATGADCNGAESCGAVYVFRFDGTAWVQEAKLLPWDLSRSQFGVSVDVSEKTIVVGAWGDSIDCDGNFCGAAYVFRHENAAWLPEAKLVSPDPRAYDKFGFSVGLFEDTIIVGSPGSDVACLDDEECNVGSAFLYRRTESQWRLESNVQAQEPTPNEQFGYSVSIGKKLVAVGSPFATYLFARLEGAWGQRTTIPLPQRTLRYFSAVDIDNSYLIAGVPEDDFAGPWAGSAIVYRVLGEPDTNGNLLNDFCEEDCNGNGIVDELDLANGTSSDCDANEIPDECEPDCNANGMTDWCDILFGMSYDCTGNRIPDECEPDCNQNDVSDLCDIQSGHSMDCSRNHIPDECEPDCNANGQADTCEIYYGTSGDCNHNGVPDECDLALGASQDCSGDGVPDECDPDCNANGAPDTCDVFGGTSPDIDFDFIPDECELWYHCMPAPGYFDYGKHRVNAQAEFLGMMVSHEIRAPDSVYDRIVRDLEFLDSTYPILATVWRRTEGLNQWVVELDLSQPHDAFDELNKYYQAEVSTWFWDMPEYKVLTFCDAVNFNVLSPIYAALSEVTWAEYGPTDGYNYNGDYIDLTVDGDAYVYKFSNGAGDCLSGCYCRQNWYFAVDPAGAITVLDYYPGSCGCGGSDGLPNQGDFDEDGVMDCLDPCPANEDAGPTDSDGDGVGDLCDACALTIPAATVDAAGCPPDAMGDIDQDGDLAPDDFARLVNCLRGPEQGGCGYPNIRPYLDGDWDVDLRDVAIFQTCFSGTNVPADASCFRQLN